MEALIKNSGRAEAALKGVAYRPDHPLRRPWPDGRPKPWRAARAPVEVSFLDQERLKAVSEALTPWV